MNDFCCIFTSFTPKVFQFHWVDLPRNPMTPSVKFDFKTIICLSLENVETCSMSVSLTDADIFHQNAWTLMRGKGPHPHCLKLDS